MPDVTANTLPLYREYALLGLIYQKPQYGYDILQKWDKNRGHLEDQTRLAVRTLNKLSTHARLPAKRRAAPIENIRSQPRRSFALDEPGAFPREFRQEWFAKLFFFRYPGTRGAKL